MSIYKREGSRFWWFKISIPKSKPRRFLRGSTCTEDKVSAEAIANTIYLAQQRTMPVEQLHRLIDVLAGVQDSNNGISLRGVLPEYERIWSLSGKKIAKRTAEDRIRGVGHFLDWVERDRPAVTLITHVDKVTASAYAEKLKKGGAKSKTRKNTIMNLSAVWEVVRSLHEIKNPWPSVVPNVDDSTRGKSFTRDQETAVLASADKIGHDWGIMCRLARHTGLRYGDIAGLTGSDIDRQNSTLRLNPSKTSRHGISVILPLPVEVAAALPEGTGYLFPEAASCLPRQRWKTPFSLVLSAAGLAGKGYTFHSWRHTFRTRLSEAGVSDDIAKRLGGWTVDTTANHYDHAERIAELRAAVELSAT